MLMTRGRGVGRGSPMFYFRCKKQGCSSREEVNALMSPMSAVSLSSGEEVGRKVSWHTSPNQQTSCSWENCFRASICSGDPTGYNPTDTVGFIQTRDATEGKESETGRTGVPHLLVEPLEDVLLRDHLEPVAVSVLAFLQLDERRHLSPEGLLAQTGQTLPEADQELLDLRLHKLGAAEVQGGGGVKPGTLDTWGLGGFGGLESGSARYSSVDSVPTTDTDPSVSFVRRKSKQGSSMCICGGGHNDHVHTHHHQLHQGVFSEVLQPRLQQNPDRHVNKRKTNITFSSNTGEEQENGRRFLWIIQRNRGCLNQRYWQADILAENDLPEQTEQ
ncbi:hypothetical protein EYF80_030256 [Liparis tanakae]|uniref:Uncharacterized protein n=1 Tax=Liparis tanakae TaxID=230148 RepID=A0A4Z2H3S5_9TELE|nr:hypothetical protein EYF80_030256 [Liparis tanakae]